MPATNNNANTYTTKQPRELRCSLFATEVLLAACVCEGGITTAAGTGGKLSFREETAVAGIDEDTVGVVTTVATSITRDAISFCNAPANAFANSAPV